MTRPADGATITLYSKGNVDRMEQAYRGQQRYELHKDGQPQRHEVHDVAMRWYGKPEMTLMLQTAGFRNIRVFGNHTEEEATSEHFALVYWAEKE